MTVRGSYDTPTRSVSEVQKGILAHAKLTIGRAWLFNLEPAATANLHPRRWLGVERFAAAFNFSTGL